MPLESILEHILAEANAQRDKIIQQAQLEADKIIREAQLAAKDLYQGIIEKEKTLYLKQKQQAVVNARLGQKRSLLLAKQELMQTVFEKLKPSLKSDKIKKEEIFIDKVHQAQADAGFYLDKLRQEYEAQIARILFRGER
jgi:V/A-type H+-transporting ATPase subunit E